MPQAGFGHVTVLAQIHAITGRLGSVLERRLWVVIADAPLRLIPHPFPIGAHVRRKPGHALPTADPTLG